MESIVIKRLLILVVLLISAIFANMPADFNDVSNIFNVRGLSSGCEAEKLCVVYIDVGQGDATLIVSPTGTQTLIDGGRDSVVLQGLSSELGFFDRDLDMVIATHPDADHIGGLIDVFDRYEVKKILRNDNEHDTPVEDAFTKASENEGAEIIYAHRGQIYDLGGGATLEILFPDRDVRDFESNTSSIVAQLTYGESKFIFSGDSPKNIEEYLVLIDGEHLKSDVLKTGHHGSRTSTSELYLDEVDPKYAIISAGKDNPYGHPHVEVTDMLFNHHVETRVTAQEGTIYAVSDGKNVTIK